MLYFIKVSSHRLHKFTSKLSSCVKISHLADNICVSLSWWDLPYLSLITREKEHLSTLLPQAKSSSCEVMIFRRFSYLYCMYHAIRNCFSEKHLVLPKTVVIRFLQKKFHSKLILTYLNSCAGETITILRVVFPCNIFSIYWFTLAWKGSSLWPFVANECLRLFKGSTKKQIYQQNQV